MTAGRPRAEWKAKPASGHIAATITLSFGTQRSADLDNVDTLSRHALIGIVYEEDRRMVATPRIEVCAISTL